MLFLWGLSLHAAEAQKATVPPKGLAGASKIGAQKVHEGVVSERIQKDPFLYLRIGEQWFAIVDEKTEKGIKIKLLEQSRLSNFYSKQLNKTFKVLIFAKMIK
ncbi:MAG: hypothetical protein I8H75_01530 [Myxococcaceae bacterium]|nr:hypothetical protein [Myxococcaceae bacterium]MBH2006020.1 hypothetical protein [Myxococcaceae bacterium]